jgi:hypothetical protein
MSAILAFRWWKPVYYSNTSASYPNTKECLARIAGIAEHQGDTMTWLLLDDATKKNCWLIGCSPNLRAKASFVDGSLRSYEGEIHKPIHSVGDLTGHIDTSSVKLPKFSPEELT